MVTPSHPNWSNKIAMNIYPARTRLNDKTTPRLGRIYTMPATKKVPKTPPVQIHHGNCEETNPNLNWPVNTRKSISAMVPTAKETKADITGLSAVLASRELIAACIGRIAPNASAIIINNGRDCILRWKPEA